MRILIVGVTGQLGRAFANYCCENNIDYLGVARNVENSSNIQRLDLLSEKALKGFFKHNKFTHIINCVAYNLVDMAEKEIELAERLNVDFPLELAKIANMQDAVLVHYSTNYVFSGEKEELNNEAALCEPKSVYAMTKAIGESQVAGVAKRFFIIRTSWLFGFGTQNFIYKLKEWINQDREISLVVDEFAAPTFTEDLVNATIALFKCESKVDNKNLYGIYHITNSGICSRYEWGEFILANLGYCKKVRISHQKDFNLPAKRPTFGGLEILKIEKILQQKMPTWQDATKRYLQKLEIKKT